MLRLHLVAFALPLLACGPRHAGAQRPAPPLIREGSCEGEDCLVAFSALACADAVLRSAPADDAPPVARIAQGDTVDVTRTDIHVLRPGLVIVRDTFTMTEAYTPEDTLRFAPGDTLHLLQYIQLGAWSWWRNGREEGGEEFWAPPPDARAGGLVAAGDSARGVARSHPEVAWWWQVALAGGGTGWWKADSARTLFPIPYMERWMERCASGG